MHRCPTALAVPVQATTYFWFDVFTNGQHKSVVRSFEWWQTVFASNIQRLGTTVLVLEWEDPRPLTRAWCLWEIVSTLRLGGDALQVVMSPAHESAFHEALVSGNGFVRV